MVKKYLPTLLKEIQCLSIRGDIEIFVKGITYDSRKVQSGFIFAALPGLHTDGHEYINQAIQNGSNAIIHTYELEKYSDDIVYIRVTQIRDVLSYLSASLFGNPSKHLRVIGVTGTDGKSTTVWFIHQLLEALGKKSGFLSTVKIKTDTGIIKNPLRQSTPEAPEVHEVLSRIQLAGSDFAVIEATSHGLSNKTKRLAHVDFDAAVLTNVTHEHLEFHGTFEQYRSDKANLFRLLNKKNNRNTKGSDAQYKLDVMKFGVVNLDDPASDFFKSVTHHKVYTYSITRKDADLFAYSFKPDPGGTSFIIAHRNYQEETRLNIPGLFNIENILAASLAVSTLLHIHIKEILPFFSKITGVRGRMTPVKEGQKFKVIVDYAHTPSSFKKIMPMMRQLTKGKLITVFGSAGERDRKKRPMQGRIASEYSDIIILTDEDPRLEDRYKILKEIAAGCISLTEGENLFLEPDREKAIALAYSLAKDTDDTVLLLGKGHESSIIYPEGPMEWDEIEIAKSILKSYTK